MSATAIRDGSYPQLWGGVLGAVPVAEFLGIEWLDRTTGRPRKATSSTGE